MSEKKRSNLNTNRIITFAKKSLRKEADALYIGIKNINRDFIKAAEILANCQGKIITSGVGKAGIIAQKMVATCISIGKQARFLHPTEAIHGDLGMVEKKDLLIFFSNSGTSNELLHLLSFLKTNPNNRKLKTIVITSQSDSTLAKNATIAVIYPSVKDGISELDCLNCVPTSSTTLMLAFSDTLIFTAEKISNHLLTKEEFSLYHPAGNIGKQVMTVDKVMLPKNKTVLVTTDTLLKDVLIQMSKKKLGCAIVVEKKKIVGFFSDGDLRRYINKNTSLLVELKELMSTKPLVVDFRKTLHEAIPLFHQYKINDIPVIDENKNYLGLLSLKDIL